MKTTAFTKYHIAAGAKMAEFAGYNMPIEFTGINDEHMAVRNGAGVFDFNQGGGHGFRRGEILVHQYDRRTGFVKVFFVFGVGQVGQGAGFALFDRGDGVHLGLFVACDLAAEKTGDHFCGKFHHSNIVIRGIFLCLFLRA